MHVPQSVKNLVVAELTKCIKVLEAKFIGYKFPMPTILYAKRGSVAGTANYARWEINLNAGLLMDPRHQVEMIEQTAPHELAHLVTFKVFPETMDSGPWRRTSRGLRRGKRELHGPRFMSVMRVMGKNEERCHDMDTSAVRVVKSNSRQDPWNCSRCGAEILLTPKKSARLRMNPDSIWHRGCRGARLIEAKGTVAQAPKPAVLDNTGFIVRHPPTLPREPLLAGDFPGASKIDVCKKLYLKYSMLSRSEIIAKFTAEAGCTPAGAATYYATCKKAYG